MDNSHLTWRKSTHSGGNGGECIEVGVWREAAQSGGNGGGYVEMPAFRSVVAIRDSKDPDGPHLAFGPSIWQSFVDQWRRRSA